MAINTYHFKLKKFSSRDQSILAAIYEFLPATGMREKFGAAVCKTVEEYVGEEFSIVLEMVDRTKFAALVEGFREYSIVSIVGMQPFSNKILLEIDPVIAMGAVERMLGGEIRTSFEVRKPSDTEQGVLQYILLEILAKIRSVSKEDARIHLRFENFAFRARDLARVAPGETDAAVLVYRAKLGSCTGFIRLVIPDLFVEEALLGVKSLGIKSREECDFEKKQLARLSHVKTELIAEAGRTHLLKDDLKQLEEGDIVLFEQADAKLAHRPLKGSVILRIGNGLHGGLDAKVNEDGDNLKCTVTGVHKGD